jgi:hypothetical protein
MDRKEHRGPVVGSTDVMGNVGVKDDYFASPKLMV